MENKMRLDKYLADYTELTRSGAKKVIRAGQVQVNGEVAKTGDDKVSFSDSVLWKDREIKGTEFQYIMFHKPAGIVSATEDKKEETVCDYVRSHPEKNRSVQSQYLAKDLFPMGRLDKDTEGLLILTNDGEMAHRLLSPGNHVAKTYFVRLDEELGDEDVRQMEEGLDIGEKRQTRPAKLQILSSREGLLTITEGKFHQVKRMFAVLGKQVLYLKRVEMAGLKLDESLEPGEWRFLTKEEMNRLKEI